MKLYLEIRGGLEVIEFDFGSDECVDKVCDIGEASYSGLDVSAPLSSTL